MNPQGAIKITQTFNGRAEWIVPGAYFKILSAPASVDVELWYGGRKVLDAPASDAGFYQRVPFDKVVLTNSGSQAVSFIAAGDQGGSDRFTGTFTAQGSLGTLVQAVMDAINTLVVKVANLFGDDVTQAAQSFIMRPTVAALAANSGYMQAMNPAASGVYLYVDRITFDAEAAFTSYSYGVTTTALATDVGTGFPKKTDGAASAAHNRTEQRAANPAGTTFWGTVTIAANGNGIEKVFQPPLRFPPGQGFIVVNNTQNQAAGCTIEYREKAT